MNKTVKYKNVYKDNTQNDCNELCFYSPSYC